MSLLLFQYGILITILCIFLSIIAISFYIKLTFRFWSEQPVFHVYDFCYYILPCGVIRRSLPEKNRYCNFKNIETVSTNKMEPLHWSQMLRLIRKHYLQSGENVFMPNKENIEPYFVGHVGMSFFSFYYDDELLIDSKTSDAISSKKLISIMTSRPMHVSINSANNSNDAVFDVYYVDYLCVDKNYRKKGIAPQMIQTHNYNQSLLNKRISVSLFKREGKLTGIVPLCVYSTIGFDMTQWTKPDELLPIVSLVECGSSNIQHLFDFYKETNKNKFDICILTETSNMMELIKTNNIFVFMMIKEGNVMCAYFFRKSCTCIKKEGEVINCFASINTCKNPDLFAHGYKVAVWKLKNVYNTYRYAVIEDISDSYTIIENLKRRSKPMLVNPTAYFFYNFAYPTFSSRRVFIV